MKSLLPVVLLMTRGRTLRSGGVPALVRFRAVKVKVKVRAKALLP